MDLRKAVFYEAGYLASYPECKSYIALGGGSIPTAHDYWLQIGMKRGHKAVWVVPADIDETAYKLHYPDVQGSAAEHFARVGNKAGRFYWRATSPVAEPAVSVGSRRPTNPVALVTYFDPAKSKYLRTNYERFRESLPAGLKVDVAELSYTGEFALPDAVLRIQGTDRQILWQKERLLNLLLDNVLPEHDAVLWMDCDILFESESWLEDTLDALAECDVVFPYTHVTRLDASGGVEREEVLNFYFEQHRTEFKKPVTRSFGLAWAFRREWLDRHRFDDVHMNGAGDSHEYFAMRGDLAWGQQHVSANHYQERWQQRCQEVRDTVMGCVPGRVFHLYHGDSTNRQYNKLEKVLKEADYSPTRDIKLAGNGLWEWCGDEAVYDRIKESFSLREGSTDWGPATGKFSDYLKKEVKAWWSTDQSKYALSKRACKELARELGLRVPRDFPLPDVPVVLKPDKGCGGSRVRVNLTSEDWLVEEYIPHEFMYRFHVLGGQVRMVATSRQEDRGGSYPVVARGYYTYPDWQPLVFLKAGTNLEVPPPPNIEHLGELARRVAWKIDVPTRVDFLIGPDGEPVFNEITVTPGLVKDGYINEHGDKWLGSWLPTPKVYLHQLIGATDKLTLPDNCCVLTACDKKFFPGFQLLHTSLTARYNVPIVLVDLGITPLQREWCEHRAGVQVLNLPETLIVPKTTPGWQHWNRPLFFQLSPYHSSLWLDCDIVVNHGLEQLFEQLSERFVAARCFAPWRREDRLVYPHRLFGTEPVNGPLVMSGVCGFNRLRDCELLHLWRKACSDLSKAPEHKRILRDQEALQWVLDTTGNIEKTLPEEAWNFPPTGADLASPESIFQTSPKEPNILHFYGKVKGKEPFWLSWGELPIW